MNQEQLSNLATPAGRAAYQAYWHDLVVERRSAVLPALWQLWRTASFGGELRISSTEAVYRVGHPLGPRVGTRVFMEEIIVRHYFNNVQALVYLGAVLLLVFLGLRFAGLLSETTSLIGVAIEAVMLLILFAVLFYSPEENDQPVTVTPAEPVAGPQADHAEQRDVIREVLEEIEEIGSSYASVAMRLEHLARAQEEGLQELSRKVGQIQGLDQLNRHSQQLETTNALLGRLVDTIDSMNGRIDKLFGKELEYYVRQELERIVRGGNGDRNRDPSSDRNGELPASIEKSEVPRQ